MRINVLPGQKNNYNEVNAKINKNNCADTFVATLEAIITTKKIE